MIQNSKHLAAALSILAVSSTSCAGSTATSDGDAAEAGQAEVSAVQFLKDKTTLENRDCVAVGRVTAQGSAVEDDLKSQSKDLGGNYVVVNAYTYKRKNLGYAVKGVAYYCY